MTAYITYRRASGRSPPPSNELAALSRMFVLAVRAGKAAGKPYIARLALNNTRTGFFERAQPFWHSYQSPEDFKPVIEVSFLTGWRVTSEFLTRQKHHLDLKAGWLRLDPGESKNRKSRMFPLTPRLREILENQLAKTEALQRATGKIIPWLFHGDGKQIKTFRRSWITACVNAGFRHVIKNTKGKVIKKVADRIPHDFRSTAVRNLERAGVCAIGPCA